MTRRLSGRTRSCSPTRNGSSSSTKRKRTRDTPPVRLASTSSTKTAYGSAAKLTALFPDRRPESNARSCGAACQLDGDDQVERVGLVDQADRQLDAHDVARARLLADHAALDLADALIVVQRLEDVQLDEVARARRVGLSDQLVMAAAVPGVTEGGELPAAGLQPVDEQPLGLRQVDGDIDVHHRPSGSAATAGRQVGVVERAGRPGPRQQQIAPDEAEEHVDLGGRAPHGELPSVMNGAAGGPRIVSR